MLKLSQKHRRNINTHLYSIKLFQNNFITFLYLYESLNYESSSMRNDYIFLKITLSPSQRSFAIKKKIKNAKLSNIETSLLL